MAKPAIKIGIKPVALLLLVIASIVVAGALFWLGGQAKEQQQSVRKESQHQLVTIVHQQIEHQVTAWQQHAALLAKMPRTVQVMASGNQRLIAMQQEFLTQLFPGAKRACLISAAVDQPDPDACLPISFATLNGIQQAKQKGHAPVAMMQLDTSDPYVLLTQSIADSNDRVLGVLLISLDKEVIKHFFAGAKGQNSYFELQQGNKDSSKLLAEGHSPLGQNKANHIKTIANSHWRLAYWQAESHAELPYQLIAVVIIGLLCVLTLLRELWQAHLSKQDAAILKQQLADLHDNKLKAHYTVSNKSLQAVAEDIHTLAYSDIAPIKKTVSKAASNTEPEVEIIDNEIEDSGQVEQEEQKQQQPQVAAQVKQVAELSPTIFKAYDIRGVVGETLSESIVKTLGQAIASLALDSDCQRLVVGRDGRLSSENYSQALIEGILSAGCDVVDIGLVPTPLVYFASEHLGTDSGVMITGSHNPVNYNGLKIQIAGKTIRGAALQKLYQRIIEGNLHTGTGNKTTVNVVDDYIKTVTDDISLNRKLSIVVDCGNGAAGVVAAKLFAALGCDVTELYCDVDGQFPNHHPNPSEPENLQDLITTVKGQNAELGLAFDGDGDRLGVVDAEGNIIWADRLMMLFAQDVLSRHPGSTILYDVKCTRLLEDVIKSADGKALMGQSGYAIIKEKMLELGAPLAGEMSGHIFFNDHWFGFDDALYSACRLLELLASDPLERTSVEVFSSLPKLENTPEIVIEMAEGESQRFMRQFTSDANFAGAKVTTIDGCRVDYPMGWGLVRASNTVPGLTLRFEADTIDNLHHIQQQFKQQILQVKPTLALHF